MLRNSLRCASQLTTLCIAIHYVVHRNSLCYATYLFELQNQIILLCEWGVLFEVGVPFAQVRTTPPSPYGSHLPFLRTPLSLRDTSPGRGGMEFKLPAYYKCGECIFFTFTPYPSPQLTVG
jgi:hypothetical protein